jgi:Aldo/keto reductase family
MSFTRKEAGLERTPDANGPAVAPAAAAGRIELGGEVIVNRLGFGAMRLARPGIPGGPQDDAEARRVLRRAVQLGVGFIDTAHAYGASERLIAEALHPYPDGLIVATKGGLGGSGSGGTVASVREQALEQSDCSDEHLAASSRTDRAVSLRGLLLPARGDRAGRPLGPPLRAVRPRRRRTPG